MNPKKESLIEYWNQIRIGKAKKVLEDFTGAIIAYNNAIEIDKNKYNAYFYRGNIHSIIKNHDSAIRDYTEALRIKKNNFCREIISEKRDRELLRKLEIQKDMKSIIQLNLPKATGKKVQKDKLGINRKFSEL